MALYENSETLKLENETRVRIENILTGGFEYKKLPIQYHLDWAAVKTNGVEILHWAELKNRAFEHTRYDAYVLSFEKVLAARKLSVATGLPSFLFLAFTDNAILRMRFDNVKDWAVEWGGRTVKTRRPGDIHPVVKIPRAWFERIA